MQDIFIQIIIKNIAPNTIPFSKNINYKTSFTNMSCEECKYQIVGMKICIKHLAHEKGAIIKNKLDSPFFFFFFFLFLTYFYFIFFFI